MFLHCNHDMQVAKEIFGDQLEDIISIRAVWDWDSLLRTLRPKRVDRGIKQQFSMVFEVRDEGTVFVRSKRAVSAKVKWGPWCQMLPHPLSETPIDDSMLDRAPATAAPKEWRKYDKVVKDLRKFYRREYNHPVVIPATDMEEINEFLDNGPSPNTPPSWIDWTTGSGVCVPVDPDDTPDPDHDAPSAPTPPDLRGNLWRPFMQPRTRCVCVGVVMYTTSC